MNIVASSVVLDVDDVAASHLFFSSHLGFRQTAEAEGYLCLSRDDAAPDVVLLAHGRKPAHSPRPTGVVVSFHVTGIAAEHHRLRGEGANITEPLRREPWGEWLLRLTDPNGVVVQLVEWLPPAGD